MLRMVFAGLGIVLFSTQLFAQGDPLKGEYPIKFLPGDTKSLLVLRPAEICQLEFPGKSEGVDALGNLAQRSGTDQIEN